MKRVRLVTILLSCVFSAFFCNLAVAKTLTEPQIKTLVEKVVKKALKENQKKINQSVIDATVKQVLNDASFKVMLKKLVDESVKAHINDNFASLKKTSELKSTPKIIKKDDKSKDLKQANQSEKLTVKHPKAVKSKAHFNLILSAEKSASPAAKKVLAMARKMTIEDKEILPGGCWDYVNAVYNRAGYPVKSRKHLFNGKYPKGPFVDTDKIKEGDWLYIINHSYKDVQHSSLFVAWTDKANKKGLMLSYAGENRKEPARYRVYDLSHVYKIVRVE